MAIQSSRISTYLHFHCAPGEVPDEAKGCYYPCRTFCGTGRHEHGTRQRCGLTSSPLTRRSVWLSSVHLPRVLSPGANHRSAQVLLLLSVPGHLVFLYTIHLLKSGHTTLTPIFMSVYLAAALLQVRTLGGNIYCCSLDRSVYRDSVV